MGLPSTSPADTAQIEPGPTAGSRSKSPWSSKSSKASLTATQSPVMEAHLVPPSATSTSQSTVRSRSPSNSRSTPARRERPMSRWIS